MASPSPTAVLQSGWTTLAQAIQEMGLTVSDAARFLVLGKSYRESGLGLMGPPTPFAQFDGTNNWGAVYWPSRTRPPNQFTKSFKEGRDTNPGGKIWTPLIAEYPTQLDGAKGVLVTYQHYGPDVLTVLADPNATSYALVQSIYKHGYFTGCHVGRDGAISLNGLSFKTTADELAKKLDADPEATTSCSGMGKVKIASLLKDTQVEADDANISYYKRMVDAGANQVRAALNVPPQPLIVPPSEPTSSSGLWWKLPIAAAAAYGGYRFVMRGRR